VQLCAGCDASSLVRAFARLAAPIAPARLNSQTLLFMLRRDRSRGLWRCWTYRRPPVSNPPTTSRSEPRGTLNQQHSALDITGPQPGLVRREPPDLLALLRCHGLQIGHCRADRRGTQLLIPALVGSEDLSGAAPWRRHFVVRRFSLQGRGYLAQPTPTPYWTPGWGWGVAVYSPLANMQDVKTKINIRSYLTI
jgi:hypothetical protein